MVKIMNIESWYMELMVPRNNLRYLCNIYLTFLWVTAICIVNKAVCSQQVSHDSSVEMEETYGYKI